MVMKLDKFLLIPYVISSSKEVILKTSAVVLLLIVTGVSLGSVVVGTPETPSMDPFCAS